MSLLSIAKRLRELREKREKGILTPEEFVELIRLEEEYERSKKLAEIARANREFREFCEKIGGTYVKEPHSWKCILSTPRDVKVISTVNKIIIDVGGNRLEAKFLQTERVGEKVVTVYMPESKMSVTFLGNVKEIIRPRTDEPEQYIQLK